MKKLVIVLFIFVLMLGCTKEQETTKFPEIAFNVDLTLLAEEFHSSEMGIKFNPPRDWKQIKSDLLTSIIDNSVASQDTSNINIVPVNIFMNKEKSFISFFSSVESKLKIDDSLEKYLIEFRTNNQDMKFNEGSFSHNGLDFHQFIFTKDDYITIKLITTVNNQKNIMIDYIVPSKNYEEELRAIESSIGTIKKQKKEIGLPSRTDL